MKEELEPQLGRVYLAGTESDLEKGKIKVGITGRDPLVRTKEGNVTTLSEDYNLLYQSEEIPYKLAGATENHMLSTFERVYTEKGRWKEFIKATLPEAVAEINRFIKANGEVPPKPKKLRPRDHQQECIDAVVGTAWQNSKASIVMPTASGKTLTSLWISEKLEAQTVLFLTPSLQLIRQTKDAWEEQGKDFVWMAVCSANDIEDRETAIEMGGGMVSTNPADIDGFLRHMTGKRVVFSTYQSLPSVLAVGHDFDLAICDEAHRTAGVSKGEESLFQQIHTDRFSAKFTLFQTATPKTFKEDLLDKVNAEEETLAFDMHNELLYGPIVYELTLGKAIELGLLCDYRILAVGVTDPEVAQHLTERTYVGDGISADEAAAPYAIQKVMDMVGCTHTISFHSRLSLAENTAKELLKAGVHADIIKGTHSTKKRAKAFKNFMKKARSVMTNAFALQEGIDIKKVDSIFFASPKASTISIIQAMGRALRLDPDNPEKIATIVVPVYTSGNPQDEVEETAFKGLYQLVSTVCEADHRVRAYVEGLTEGKGARGEQEPIDYIKLADFERLDFVDFTKKLRDAFILKTLKKRVYYSFDEGLERYKKAMGL